MWMGHVWRKLSFINADNGSGKCLHSNKQCTSNEWRPLIPHVHSESIAGLTEKNKECLRKQSRNQYISAELKSQSRAFNAAVSK